MNIDFEQLQKDKEKNAEERLEFVKFWANYIKTHSDKEWSKQQNIVINSQFQNKQFFGNV